MVTQRPPKNRPDTPLPKTPRWDVWGARHKATVFQAVCLALNLHPKRPTAKSGKVPNNAGAKLLRSHINTTLQWLNLDPELMPLEPGSPTDESCLIGLPEFIEWLGRKRLRGVEPPAELLSLTPPNPRSVIRATQPDTGAPHLAGSDAVDGHMASQGTVSTAERLLPGLLIAYIKDLVERAEPPNLKLVSKEKKRISMLALARQLQSQVRHRTDQKTTTSSTASGLTEESLRKAIAKALNQLNPSLGDAGEDSHEGSVTAR
jgi:hypothetical protein